MTIYDIPNHNMIIWFFSITSGISLLFYYFQCAAKEKRLPDATKYTDLKSRIETQNEDIDRLRAESQDLQKLKAEHDQYKASIELKQNRLEELERELETINIEYQRQLLLREELASLESHITKQNEEKTRLDIELEDAQKLLDTNAKENQRIETRCSELKIEEAELQAKQEEIVETIKSLKAEKEHSSNELNNIQQRQQEQNIRLVALQQELADLENRITGQNEEKTRLGIELEDAQKLLDTNAEENQRIEERCLKLKKEETELQAKQEEFVKTIKNLNIEKEHSSNELDDIRQHLLQLEQEQEIKINGFKSHSEKYQEDIREHKNEISNLQQNKTDLLKEKEQVESQRNVLKLEYEGLTSKVNHLKEAKAKPEISSEKAYFIHTKESRTSVTEENALKKLRGDLEKSNLFYPKRLVDGFHTSLKINDISPLVVLAGISGTGKSALPQVYAKSMGIHFLNIAVQPRWDSPQDIFGFYNYLEQKYKTTELTKVLIQAERHNRGEWEKFYNLKEWPNLKDQLVLALFDEMNLARVEYYFSDLLSKLEMRRGINPESSADRQKAEILLDTGLTGQSMRLFVDKNVLFVGTMNEDESTQMLSDKILDRSNMLRFGRPKKLASVGMKQNFETASDTSMTLKNWEEWIKTPKENIPQIEDWIHELNQAMEKVGKPFGHRVGQAIQAYVANYPGQEKGSMKLAFADQIEQRILPKLRNLHCQESQNALEAIRDVMEKVEDKELIAAFDKSCAGTYFEWKGVERD